MALRGFFHNVTNLTDRDAVRGGSGDIALQRRSALKGSSEFVHKSAAKCGSEDIGLLKRHAVKVGSGDTGLPRHAALRQADKAGCGVTGIPRAAVSRQTGAVDSGETRTLKTAVSRARKQASSNYKNENAILAKKVKLPVGKTGANPSPRTKRRALEDASNPPYVSGSAQKRQKVQTGSKIPAVRKVTNATEAKRTKPQVNAVPTTTRVKAVPVNVVRPTICTTKTQKTPQKSKEIHWDLTNLSHVIHSLLNEIPEGVTDVDKQETDYFNCPEYANDVVSYLQTVEKRFQLPADFLHRDNDVNANMHGVLADWLIQVQNHLGLEAETLHKTIAFVDIYLVRKQIDLNRLQLLGITTLLIATKIEERFAPSIKKLIHLTDDTYTYEEVIQMELDVLKVLKFELYQPTPITFLDRWLKVSGANSMVEMICLYLLDRSLTDSRSFGYSPSVRSAAALRLALAIDAEGSCTEHGEWTKTLTHYTTYTEHEIQPCVQRYARSLLKAETSKFQGAREKYSSRAFKSISNGNSLSTSKTVLQYANLDNARQPLQTAL